MQVVEAPGAKLVAKHVMFGILGSATLIGFKVTVPMFETVKV